MENHTSAYVPGVCNINSHEVSYRRKAGMFGLVLSGVFAVAFFAIGASQWAYAILIVPVFMAVIGLLQARARFCTGYGASGQQNAEEGSASSSKVTDTADLAKDRRRSLLLNIEAIAITLAVTAGLAVVLPLLRDAI